jgi:hypothetical protein
MQIASETCRVSLQLLINILPSCITLVLYIYVVLILIFKNIHPLFHTNCVFDYPLTYLVVEVMHDGSRTISREVSAVIYNCLYTVYVYCVTFISAISFIPHVDCCEIVLCWIQVTSVI